MLERRVRGVRLANFPAMSGNVLPFFVSPAAYVSPAHATCTYAHV